MPNANIRTMVLNLILQLRYYLCSMPITLPPILIEGQRIETRGEQFIVLSVTNLSDGQRIRVQGISELVRYQVLELDTRLEQSLKVLDTRKRSLVQDAVNGSTKVMLSIETAWRYAAVAKPVITLAGTAGINLADYQRIPTEGALALPQPRILLADGVGMGKTIQVGMLLAELMRRGRADRILVIALKSILTKFQQELWQRFAIPLKRLDSQGIAQIRSEIPGNKNPFDIFDKSIISIDTLKNVEEFRQKLDKARWDVIVIDECHVVANDASMRGQLAERLAKQCDALILTSATPHNGKPENFKNLLNLLDPTIIGANGAEMPQKEDLQHMVFRRFKHHIVEQNVQDQFQDRVVEALPAELSARECAVLELQYALRQHECSKSFRGSDLFSITLFKSILSSPSAAIETIAARLRRHLPTADNPLNDPIEYELLVEMQDLLNEGILAQEDSKLEMLVQQLKKLKLNNAQGGERFVIFSERIWTLEYLQKRLKEAFGLKDEQVPKFEGSLTDTEQQALVESFGRQDSPIKVLLASDSGSQGVNLHYFCNHMFNYDLPWSIITLEQRNGRIDRYGQSKTPYIYYLINKTSQDFKDLETDLRILDRLRDKEEQVHMTLGDASSVMKLYNSLDEEKLVMKALAVGDVTLLDQPETASAGQEEIDWLEALFDQEEAATPALSQQSYIPPTLFANAFEYYKLLTTVQDPQEVNIEVSQVDRTLSYEPTFNNEVASRGQQLAQRFRDALPAELFPTRSDQVVFRLTTDKELVMKSIQDARGSQNGKRMWADWQPLYDLHPAVMMMVDKFRASTKTNEIPLACFRHRVPMGWDGKAYYICRITQANLAGYNVLDDFRVIQVNLEDYTIMKGEGEVLSLETWSSNVRPKQGLAEFDLQPHILEALQQQLSAVVDMVDNLWETELLPAAKQHLIDLSTPRATRIKGIIDRLEGQLAEADNPQRRASLDNQLKAAKAQQYDLNKITELEPKPYIDVIAVWVQAP